MSVLLQVSKISKSYGPTVILDEATASFGDEQKIGMIGRNGAGKSTLCRIITGHETAESGEIIRNTMLKLSYLEQHDTFKPGESVLDFLTRTTGAESWRCGETAARFRIKNELLSIPVQNLPGGYQTRVKLTAMLLGEPNFLILDEPSNFLDLSTMILLEHFLQGFRGGYLVVSHDREFLKRTCDHTLELEAGRLTLYPGDIEEYFEFKEEQIVQQQAQNKSIQKKRDQLQMFIDRFRAKASTASRAQSKMKQLQKLKRIEIAHHTSTVRIHIPQAERRSGIAFTCENLSIGYPEKLVAAGINMEIDRGKHVAILGDNGQGKTTFLKTMSGELAPKSGMFKWGNGIQVAYYAQHVFSALHAEDTVYSHLAGQGAEGVTHQEILAMAGSFLFKGDDVKKKVTVLSGGERARLVLAGLLLSKSQVLLLDEPTNHLDFETVEALGHALKRFTGTVFFISHDRTFVNLVASDILEVRQGRIRRYPGTYEDYVYHLETLQDNEDDEDVIITEQIVASTSSAATKQQDPLTVEQPPAAVGKSDGRFEQKKQKSEISKIKKLMEKAEQRMERVTRERDQLLAALRDAPFFYSKDRDLRLKQLQVDVEEAEEAWCALQAKLDELK